MALYFIINLKMSVYRIYLQIVAVTKMLSVTRINIAPNKKISKSVSKKKSYCTETIVYRWKMTDSYYYSIHGQFN
jgi:hypothetical protein